MHMRIQMNDGLARAVPLFGLNAPAGINGVLMVSARHDCDTCVIGILPFVPSGRIQADQSVLTDADPTGLALVETTIVAEGGFCFDGIDLSDVQYLYCAGGRNLDDLPVNVDIDVSFAPNRVPVEVK